MQTFAQRIRELRLQKGVPLRKVAAFLDIDQAILSKIETGKREATRDNALGLASYYGIAKEDLLILWLSDRIVRDLEGEDLAYKALRTARKLMKQASDPALKSETTNPKKPQA